MGLVLILTGGAIIVLKAYNAAGAGGLLATAIPALRQQAAVVGTLAAMVFLLLDALEKGKVAMSMIGAVTATAATATNADAVRAAAQAAAGTFGRPGIAAIATGV